MRSIVILTLAIILISTHEIVGQKLIFKKVSIHETIVYLKDNFNNITDTLELKSIYSDNSYTRKDSSIFFVKMFVSPHTYHPIVYQFFEYKIIGQKFEKISFYTYRQKHCDRSEHDKIFLAMKFTKKAFVLSLNKNKEKSKLIIPLEIFSVDRLQAVLPDCW